jgi:cytochrome c6
MTPLSKKFAAAALAILVIAFVATAQENKPGTELFKKSCAMCHSADGSGSSPMGQKMGVRDLRSAEVQKQTDAQLTEIVSKGKGKMPAYGDKLKPEQVKDLVACIRGLKK